MSSPDLKIETTKAWRLLTAPFRFLPSFFVPGAPKCGTSSLYDCLRMHPQFATSKRKEPTNFIHHPTSALRSRMNFPLKVQSLFRGPMIAAEASVEYFSHPDAPDNIKQVVPEAKLIFMMRNPIQRAWSDYQMLATSGVEQPPFEVVVKRAVKWLNNPDDRALVDYSLRMPFSPVRPVYCGAYMENIHRWLKSFPREKCLFLLSEDFFANPQLVMDEVFNFVGLSPCKIPEIPHARSGKYRDQMNAETENVLREYFLPRNAELAAFLGRSLPW